MMKTRLEQLYQTLVEITKGNQKKVQVTSCLSVYFGISTDGYIRLSFMSSIPAPKLDSTKLLKITQGQEEQDVYWTSFDLLQEDAKVVFFTFCEDMIRSITDIKEEMVALTSIKKRYTSRTSPTKHGAWTRHWSIYIVATRLIPKQHTPTSKHRFSLQKRSI